MSRVLFTIAALLMGQVAAADSERMNHFLSWFEGEFDNNEQVWQQTQDGIAEEDRHEHIHHIFKAVDVPAMSGHTFFVKQYQSGDYEDVYRQRLYRFTWDDQENAVRLAIHSFADDAPYRYADREPGVLADLDPATTRNMPGCDVFWTFHEDHYVGKMKENACFYFSKRLGKNIYITDTLKLTEDMIWIGDKAFDEDGNKIFGRDERHQNRKVRYFKGWAAIRNDRFREDAEGDEEMAFFADLRLHNEGQQLPLITKDGVDSGYVIELSRLTYQNTNVAVLKLGLIEKATGKTFTYSWTNPGAERIGINLRWMQVGLTSE